MTGRSFTVLGAGGFIGGALADRLRRDRHHVTTPGRADPLPAGDLGHVVYCIGLTADFRRRPFDTMEAHVCRLLEVLRHGRFASLLYLSSTRVYGAADSASPDAALTVRPDQPSDLYNLSKLAGESLCLSHPRDTVRVVRLSNVYGAKATAEDFLHSLTDCALTRGHIQLHSALTSSKDYIDLEDVVAILPRIALEGKRRLYNLAAGENVTHETIVTGLQRLTGCSFGVDDGAPEFTFPTIDIGAIRAEFGFSANRLLDRLDDLVAAHRQKVVL